MLVKPMCRVCLVVDVRMHTIVNTPLQEIYEKITNISMSIEDKLVHVCYICHAHLKRCYVLMQKAYKSQQLFTDILSKNCDLLQTVNKTYVSTNNYTTSQIEHISTVDLDTTPLIVKIEPKCETEKGDDEQHGEADSDRQPNTECEPFSDSEDDVPLKNFSGKARVDAKVEKQRRKPRQKRKHAKGFSADFAKEILLSEEEQRLELLARKTSLNYLNAPLRCELCFKGFVDTRAYDNHMEKHDEKSGPHECPICRMRYVSARQLRMHAVTSHRRRYACSRCPHRSHTANQARVHEKWHSGFTYACKLCGQTFRKPTSYLSHMRKRHATQHACDICGDSFAARHGLLMHRSKSHRGHEPKENTAEPASERYCEECDIQFITKDAWKRHILSSVKHTPANEENPDCRICGARLTSSVARRAHRRQHEAALRARAAPPPAPATALLACEQCGSRFVNRSKLQAHIKRIHLGLKYNKNIVCEVCGKNCTSNATLKYHQRTHTGEKPFQCSSCNKCFADTNQLRIHTRMHTGERPYCCAACGKRFSQKPALNRHYRVHTGAKPYVCQFCSKNFSQSNSLKVHVKTVHLKMPPNKKTKNSEPEIAKLEEPVLIT